MSTDGVGKIDWKGLLGKLLPLILSLL